MLKKKSPKKNAPAARAARPLTHETDAPTHDDENVLEDNIGGEGMPDLLDEPAGEPAQATSAVSSDDLEDEDAPRLPTRYLEHILTPSEIDEKREERERGDVQREKLEMDLATATARVKDLKTQIEAIDVYGRELSRVIRAGVEYRDVECREERAPDWRKGEPTFGTLGIITVRCDTDEPLEWRPLTKQERQGKLFDEAGAA